ncbi:MAG: hypothetical protein HDR33_00855 [Treponema sp.]|nr:hypothetical protein [Treponema sp.]
MYEKLVEFLSAEECFIEAEGKRSSINNFIDRYNRDFGATLRATDDGIILLQDDANKWGLELRLYVRSCPPINVKRLGFTHNNAYRNDFTYRLNNNDIVNFLFDIGYRIGFNRR